MEIDNFLFMIQGFSTPVVIKTLNGIDNENHTIEKLIVEKLVDARREFRRNKLYDKVMQRAGELKISVPDVLDFLKSTSLYTDDSLRESILIELEYLSKEMLNYNFGLTQKQSCNGGDET